MELPTFQALLAPSGQELLREVGERAGVESDLALGTRLRATHDPALVAAAVTQHHLRDRAAGKFGADAARLYFTPEALEQATRGTVSAHRARRLRDAGATAVADLGCGIGGDLIAFARAGLRVRGIEADPVRAAIASANLAALGLTGEVVAADALTTELRADETAFVDPVRRTARGRVFSTADLVPPWEWIVERLRGAAVAKVMPGIGHDAIPPGVEAEWVSDGGDLVEACLWGAPYATATRRATLLPSGASLVASGAVPEVGDVGAVLYEPDDAVIRAGLVAEFAAGIGGRLPDPHLAYVTADAAVATPFARGFAVLEELPFREKALRAALRARGVGTLTVKKRGVEIVPEHLVRRLRLDGSIPATIVLTRVAGGGRAFLVEPLAPARA